MAFSPDDKVLALGGTCNTIRLFDTTTGKPLHPRDGHTSPVEAVGFLPHGDIMASVSGGHVVRLADDSYVVDPYGEVVVRSRRHREDFLFADVDPVVTDKAWKVGRSLWGLRELHKQLLDAAGLKA